MSQPQYEEWYEDHKETEAVNHLNEPEKKHIQGLEDEITRLQKLLAEQEIEKRKSEHLRKQYQQQKDFFYQERAEAELRGKWLQQSYGRALDLIRRYIDAHYNLYDEFPKFVPVPKELYRELHPTEKVEFYHMHHQMQYRTGTTQPFEYEVPHVSRISVALVEIDQENP